MKISLIQTNAQADKTANLKQAQDIISKATQNNHPNLIALPEVFNFIGNSLDARKAAAETLADHNNSETYQFLKAIAQQYNATVHGGSILEYQDGKYYNTSVIFNPQGMEIARYRKIHLFDATMSCGMQYRESDIISAGNKIVTYNVGDITIGCSICYDLRFAELYLALAKHNAKVIMIPAAFTYATGQAHWEILLRARAIESQCYIVASNQTGSYPDGDVIRKNWGHSMVVDPWGNIIAQMQEEIGYINCELNFDKLADIRTRMPMHNHRKL